MQQRLLAIFAAAVLAGCSAGGKTSTTTTTTASAADLVVTLDKSSLSDTGSDSATITVTAVDSNRNVVASVPVSIVPESTSGAIITPSGSTTSSAGVVTGALSIGSDHSNRTITVVVTSGSVKKTVTIGVAGAALTANAVSGTAGSTASVIYHLADSSGSAMPAMPITVAADGMATVQGSTDTNGNYTYTYTVPNTATLNISATAGGVTTTSTVTVSASSTPAASGTPASESIIANPSFVSVNTAGSTTNQTDVRTLFLGTGNLPISNVRVRFDLGADTSNIGGTLASGTNYVYSDVNGIARTTYIPGTRGSGNNAVTIRACWSATDFAAGTCPNSMTAPVTVIDSGISLSIFTNGKIVVDDTRLIYTIPFAVQVVDSAGNPQSGIKVNGKSYIPRYYRGSWETITSTSTNPVSGVTTTTTNYEQHGINVCDNEDINGSTNLDTGEDANQSGKLEPYAADVAITPTSSGSDTTDSAGKAYFTMQYGQNVASWDEYLLTFDATIQSTEGTATISGILPVPADVVAAAATTTPPFQDSPYNLLPSLSSLVAQVGTVAATNTATPPVTYNLCLKQN